jgi:hypothetical protein
VIFREWPIQWGRCDPIGYSVDALVSGVDVARIGRPNPCVALTVALDGDRCLAGRFDEMELEVVALEAVRAAAFGLGMPERGSQCAMAEPVGFAVRDRQTDRSRVWTEVGDEAASSRRCLILNATRNASKATQAAVSACPMTSTCARIPDRPK